MTYNEFAALCRPCADLHTEFLEDDCYSGEFADAPHFGYVVETPQHPHQEKLWVVMTDKGMFDVGISTHNTLAEALQALYDYCF